MPPLALVNGSSHWWPPSSQRWVEPMESGLMPSGPSFMHFNWIDLYSLGIMTWEDIEGMSLWVRDPKTRLEYQIVREDLVTVLEEYENYLANTPLDQVPTYLHGDDYMEGDGIRIPNGDPTMLNLKTLIVVVTGAESIFDQKDRDNLMQLARDIPGDWNQATQGFSNMSPRITHKRINHFTKNLNNRRSLKILAEDFANAFYGYDSARLEYIRFERLPTDGNLMLDGERVEVDKRYSYETLENQELVYHRSPNSGFLGDKFKYNVMANGRWAAPANIIIENEEAVSQARSSEGASSPIVEESLLIYPNSFENELNVRFINEGGSDVDVQIYDLNGRRIYHKLFEDLDKGLQSITLDNLPQTKEAVLNLMITNSSGTVSHKLINKKQ